MASSMIHVAVAKEINKTLKRKEHDLLLGSIAPDLSKHVNETKIKSHFLDDLNDSAPIINRFLNKYEKYLNDDFVMGYYIHLYTDYLWFKYFISEIFTENEIKKLDGTTVKLTTKLELKYIYNDYTNLTTDLLDKYDLNLSIFYLEIPEFKNIIEEIPMDKLKLLVDATGISLKEEANNKSYVFTKEDIDQFIQVSVELILSDILENHNV